MYISIGHAKWTRKVYKYNVFSQKLLVSLWISSCTHWCCKLQHNNNNIKGLRVKTFWLCQMLNLKKNLSFYINWQGPAAAIRFAGQMKREELRAQMAQSHLKTPSLFQGYQLTIKIKTSFKTLLNMYVCVLNYARKKSFYLQFYFELKNCFHPIQTILCGNIIYIYVIAYANLQLNQISSLGGIEFFIFF